MQEFRHYWKKTEPHTAVANRGAKFLLQTLSKPLQKNRNLEQIKETFENSLADVTVYPKIYTSDAFKSNTDTL